MRRIPPWRSMFKHVYEPLPQPRQLRADLPAGVEEVILKAIAKDPADRYDRAGKLAKALRMQLYSSSRATLKATTTQPLHLFLCYKRNAEPDQQLADYLYEFLTEHGHNVFIDRTMRAGETWLEEIDRQIKDSDYLVVLLSESSAHSEMVQAEIKRAYEYRKLQERPQTLPVRVAYEGLLPYSIDAFLDPLQYVIWQSETDTARVGQEILAAIAGRLPQQTPIPIQSQDGEICPGRRRPRHR